MELYHHGIKGQRWGVRRFQNADGTLTSAGKKRYNTDLDSLHGYSRVAGSKVVSKIRKAQAHKNELEMVSARHKKADYQSQIQELNNIDRVSAKYGGMQNTKLAKAFRGVQKNNINMEIEGYDRLLSEGKKKQSKISEMDKAAQKYRADHAKPMTKEQKAAARKGRINYAIDNQIKAIGNGAVGAGVAFTGAYLLNRVGDKSDVNSLKLGTAAVSGFVAGYAGANLTQLMMDSGIYKVNKK